MTKIIKIIIIISIFNIRLFGQLPPGLPLIQNFYETDKYQNQTWQIIEGNDGLLYIANEKYLLRFDGFKFKSLHNFRAEALLSIAEYNGEFYLGTSTGIFVTKHISDSIEIKSLKINYSTPNVRYILKKEKSLYFFIDKKNVLSFDGHHLHLITRPSNFSILRGFMPDNHLFVVSMNGIAEIKNNKLDIFSYKHQQIYKEDIRIFLKYPDDSTYLIGTKAGNLYLYDKNKDTFTAFNVKNFDIGKPLYYTASSVNDTLFAIGTLDAGMFLISRSGNVLMHLSKNNGLLSDAVYSITVDKNKNLWLGTSKGLTFVKLNSPLYSINSKNGISDVIFSVHLKDNYLFISTAENFLIYNLNDRNLHPVKKYPYKYGEGAVDLKVNGKKYTGVSAYNKFFILDENLNVVYEKKGNNTILLSSTGYDSTCFYYLGTSFRLMQLKEQNGKISVQEKNLYRSLSLPFKTMQLDKYKDLWLAMGDVLFCLDTRENIDSAKIVLINTNSLHIADIFETENRIYFTTDKGLYFLQNKKEKDNNIKLVKDTMFRDFTFSAILKKGDTYYFLSDEKGKLYKFTKHKLLDSLIFPSGNFTKKQILSYKNYIIFPSNDKIYFVYKDFKNPLGDVHSKKIKFLYYSVNQKIINEISETNDSIIQLDKKVPNKSELSFYFTVSPIDIKKYNFYYKLDDADSWQKLNSNELIFRHIEFGKHALKIKAEDEKNTFYSPSIEFTVTPPFYFKLWAIALYLLILLFLSILTTRLWTRRMRRRKAALEAEIEKRVKELSDQQSKLQQKEEIVVKHKKRLDEETKRLKLTLFELKQMSLAVQKTEDSVLILNKSGRFEWWNRAFAELFKNKFEQYKNLSPKELHKKLRPDVYRELKKYDISKGTIQYTNHEIFDNGDEIWYKTTITPIIEEGKLAGYIVLDKILTDYKLLQNSLFNQKEMNTLLKEKINLLKAENSLLKTDIEKFKYLDAKNKTYATYLKKAIDTNFRLSQNFEDYFIVDLPQNEVSGDFVWVRKRDNTIYIALGDAPGHRVKGAIMHTIAHLMLNRSLREGDKKPSEIISDVNNYMVDFFEKNHLENDALFLGVFTISLDDNKLLFSGARIPLIIYREKDKKAIKFEPHHNTLGIRKGFEFKNQEIIIEKNDKIYIYSDGWANQLGSMGIKKYSHKRILQFIENIQDITFEIHDKLIIDEIRNWQKKFEQIDDIMVLGIKI